MVDPGECFAHMPCQQDSECNVGEKCCDVQCSVPICIAKLEVPDIGKPSARQPTQQPTSVFTLQVQVVR